MKKKETKKDMGKAKVQDTCCTEFEKPKPTISLSEKEVPAIKDWVIGGKYTIEANVEMISISKDQWGKEKGLIEARFNILDVTESIKTTKSDKKADEAFKVSGDDSAE